MRFVGAHLDHLEFILIPCVCTADVRLGLYKRKGTTSRWLVRCDSCGMRWNLPTIPEASERAHARLAWNHHRLSMTPVQTRINWR